VIASLHRMACLACLACFASACALLSKSDPVVPRYFSPEIPDTAASAGVPTGLSVRVGRVGGGSYLKERIAYRDSDHEFGFYDDRRWTERPEVYLERALDRSLFESHGLKRALSPSAPTLTVELVEFEEVRGAEPRARLRVSYALQDDTTVFFERWFAIERPLLAGTGGSQADRLAAGLGVALRDAVARIVDDVIADLPRDAPTRPDPLGTGAARRPNEPPNPPNP
jgi:cholesterol transport system auxiliary component